MTVDSPPSTPSSISHIPSFNNISSQPHGMIRLNTEESDGFSLQQKPGSNNNLLSIGDSTGSLRKVCIHAQWIKLML